MQTGKRTSSPSLAGRPWRFAASAVVGLSLLQSVAAQSPGPSVDFGPNVNVFDPSMPAATIQARLTSVFKTQETNQFGMERNAFLFKPGTYSVDANIGFNTQIAGLGMMPDDVTIKGNVHAEADWMHDNGTDNFWRCAENMLVIPPDGRDRWAVSQAAPFRRMHIQGKLQLDPRGHGWSSGGFVADSVADSDVSSGSQQQYMSRNDEFGSWSGSVWNMVFVGVTGAPTPHFPNPAHTVVDQTPVIREKPFLCVDKAGGYQVFVPALRRNASGTTWHNKTPEGTTLPLSQFFIVKPGMTATSMNGALAQGKNLLVTPGVYHLNQTLNISRADTVVLGLGMATFVPDGGVVAVKIADVDGVKMAGILLDAGQANSPTMLEVGATGGKADHAANPISLHDVFVRIGGAGPGKASVAVRINSNDTIIDHTWIWRADHGAGAGWESNPSDYGIIVNGNDVTTYGLFVEHFQKYDVVWNGNGGRTYMFQNEMAYDPPTQDKWMNGTSKGYAAYKVADTVTTHEGWGLGSYCYFNVNPNIVADHAFEVPQKPGVKLHNVLTVSLGGKGTITNVVNNAGAPTSKKTTPSCLADYPEQAGSVPAAGAGGGFGALR